MTNVQILITTMNLVSPYELLEKMNISSSFLIGNQADRVEDTTLTFNGFEGKIFSRKEKGVGRNRNLLLQNASGKYCLLGDDDMVFDSGYGELVERLFEENGEADVLVFNLKEANTESVVRTNRKKAKVNIFNYMNYGAARIAFRLSSIQYAGIFFNVNFGGGTRHSCGEDTLFLRECLSKGLRVFTVPFSIATLREDRESTWFKGYTKKYFYDKGVILGLAHPCLGKLFALYLAIRHRKDWHCENWTESFGEMLKGINYIKNSEYR